MQKRAMETAQRILAHPFARPRILPNCGQRRIRGPAGDWRAVGHEERCDQDEESDEGGPEGHHVEAREGHVFRADLNGQKVIAEAREWRIGENEEHHDRAVHGHQREVILGRDDAAGRAVRRKFVEQRNRGRTPGQVDAHEPGEHHAGDYGDERQAVVLQPDDFVVETEYVIADEALRRRSDDGPRAALMLDP